MILACSLPTDERVKKAAQDFVMRLTGPVDSNLCNSKVWAPFCKAPTEDKPAGPDVKKKVSPKEEAAPETK